MTIDKAVLSFAGFMVLLSAVLVLLVSKWWLVLTFFIGANLLQTGFSGLCPAAWAFRKMGLRPGCAFN